MGYKLLLADDSITIQKVVSIIFAGEDCELTIVGDGIAAVEKAVEILPDIMLLDALMPGMSGYEVCEAVRRDHRLRGTPILLLTGAFEPFDPEKASISGADDFISKPFESQGLIDKVRSLIELGRERKSSAREMAVEPGIAPNTLSGAAPAGDFAGTAEVVPLEDDPWGMIDLASIGADQSKEHEEQPAAGPVEETIEFTGAPVSWDAFSDDQSAHSGADAPLAEEPPFDPFALSTGDEDASAAPPVPGFETDTEGQPFFPAGVAPEPAPSPAGAEEYFFAESVSPAGEVETASRVSPGATPSKALPELSEEQLTAIVSRISREVIERVVWEVVPDLAETLIKEEIRKIKEGI
ncbi:response regulator [Geobacter sp. DSM 9736]|uniref:response regulator n=1 Tax=Geobacter sp. DSM 9736 TaxID=1277350 RepID=UPI000B50A2D9|nr:response regulator [Geobacter sp. DSM 9736]SNB46206.1 Response regulator receiver domain-containing protein [Geobacter sp. DSM 9736]